MIQPNQAFLLIHALYRGYPRGTAPLFFLHGKGWKGYRGTGPVSRLAIRVVSASTRARSGPVSTRVHFSIYGDVTILAGPTTEIATHGVPQLPLADFAGWAESVTLAGVVSGVEVAPGILDARIIWVEGEHRDEVVEFQIVFQLEPGADLDAVLQDHGLVLLDRVAGVRTFLGLSGEPDLEATLQAMWSDPRVSGAEELGLAESPESRFRTLARADNNAQAADYLVVLFF